MIRIGYDRIEGYLRGGMHAWETSGRPFDSIPVVTASHLKDQLADREGAPTVLDVRKVDEFQAGHLEGAQHLFLGDLPDSVGEVPRDNGRVITFCGSGRRASIAASILRRNGVDDLGNNLGSMEACKAIGCKIVQ